MSFLNYSGELTPNNSSLFIGVDSPGAIEYFHGCLDDIRIYRRGLNEEEILVLFEEGTVNLNPRAKLTCEQVRIFPNPLANMATINFSNLNQLNYTLSIFNTSGYKVFEKMNINSDKIEFERGNLSNGVYLVELKGEKVFRGKMVVK